MNVSNSHVISQAVLRLSDNRGANLEDLKVYHSSVQYALSSTCHLIDKRYTLEEMANLMVEEGLLYKGRPVKLDDLVTTLDTKE